jgi:hypothetical protein
MLAAAGWWLAVLAATPAVHGHRRGAAIRVEGDHFAPDARLVVEVDVTWPHASVACATAWRRDVTADAAGHIVVTLAPRGNCAFGRDRFRVFVEDATSGNELAVSPVL